MSIPWSGAIWRQKRVRLEGKKFTLPGKGKRTRRNDADQDSRQEKQATSARDHQSRNKTDSLQLLTVQSKNVCPDFELASAGAGYSRFKVEGMNSGVKGVPCEPLS